MKQDSEMQWKNVRTKEKGEKNKNDIGLKMDGYRKKKAERLRKWRRDKRDDHYKVKLF